MQYLHVLVLWIRVTKYVKRVSSEVPNVWWGELARAIFLHPSNCTYFDGKTQM
jgi:hypothetical protein